MRTVVMLAPPGSGLRSLLRTLPDGLTRGGSGFPASWSMTLDDQGTLRGMGLLGAPATAVLPDETRSYDLSLELSVPRRLRWHPWQKRSKATSHRFTLHTFRSARLAASSRLGSFAFVLVWPFPWVTGSDHAGDNGWVDEVRRHASALGKAQRIYVVLSQFDQVLIEMSHRPREALLDRDFVASAIRDLVKRNVELKECLSALAKGGNPVRLLPASAHGIIKPYCSSNWYPTGTTNRSATDRMLIGPDGGGALAALMQGWHPHRGKGLADEFAELWVPLFTADAVVAAVAVRGWRRHHDFFFRLEEAQRTRA